MSFDLGKDASFNPPPPPKKRLSPWAVVGIGCSVLLVGSVVGIGGCVVAASNLMKEEMKKPVNKAEILTQLGDTPLYPNVQFDENVTRAGRAGMRLVERFNPAKKMVMGGFRVQAQQPQDIYDWYTKKLATMGFALEKGQSNRQYVYRRDNEMILVQAHNEKGEWTGIVLMRFTGVRKR